MSIMAQRAHNDFNRLGLHRQGRWICLEWALLTLLRQLLKAGPEHRRREASQGAP